MPPACRHPLFTFYFCPKDLNSLAHSLQTDLDMLTRPSKTFVNYNLKHDRYFQSFLNGTQSKELTRAPLACTHGYSQ